jgi:DNA-binding NarL/FixJ family response regulator
LNKPTVLIADDHPLIVEGIVGLLRAEYDVLGTCSDGREMVAKSELLRPRIVVFDIGMPLMNGIEAAARISVLGLAPKLVCVTQQVDQQYLVAALNAGANAFVAKQSAANELCVALAKVLAGGTYITPLLAHAYQESQFMRPITASRSSGDVLTPRQREVLQLVAEGRQSKEIASTLNISTKTVEFHRGALMNILGLRSAVELTRYAINHGIVSSGNSDTSLKN